MNRKQKRSKTKKAPAVQSFADRVAVEIEAVKRAVCYQAVTDMTAAFIISLNDEFGFGKDRIYRLLSKVNTQFECITHGDVTIEDIKLWCIEKGIDYRLITGEDAENGK